MQWIYVINVLKTLNIINQIINALKFNLIIKIFLIQFT